MGYMGYAQWKHGLAKTFDSLAAPGVYSLELLGEVCASDGIGDDRYGSPLKRCAADDSGAAVGLSGSFFAGVFALHCW